MRIVIVCGGEECGKEFNGDTKEREWTCPHCGRLIPNRYYPFLSARFMNARIKEGNVDWEEMYGALKGEAVRLHRDRQERIARLRRALEGEEHDPMVLNDEPAIFEPIFSKEGSSDWHALYEELLEIGKGAILALDDEIASLKERFESEKEGV